MTEKALVVCNHPGGARAVVPVVEKMVAELPGLCFELWLTRHSLPLVELPAGRTRKELWGEDVSPGEYRALDLRAYRFVLTGTSIAGNLETSVIQRARLQRVPVFTVLDHWCEYGIRFGEHDGKLTAIPDVVFVPDAIAEADLLALGVPPGQVVVSGHPAFDQLSGIRARFTERRRRAILDDLDLPDAPGVVLFVSEPVAADHGDKHLGYSEFSVLRTICAALERLSPERRPSLVIKPHPREAPDKFDKLVAAFPGLRTRTAGASIDRHDLILASNLVLGIDSVMLLEAAILGAPVYSVQIGAGDPHSVSARLGRVPVIRDPETLADLLRSGPPRVAWAGPEPALEASRAIVDTIRAHTRSGISGVLDR